MSALTSSFTLQGGKYQIIKTLGQGGFGITYEAEQVALHRRVAIKEFFMKDYCDRDSTTSHVTLGTSEGSKELVERFRSKFIREAQMIAGLDDPHIIKIHDIFEENGTAYYVMAFLDGGSLSDLVKKNGPLPENQAVSYIKQVGNALDYIHKQNVLHLDVKPSNILLNASGEAVLIDFGISKHYDAEGGQTSTTPVGISKGYAPMEQYQQGNITKFSPATDIYSLGATLYFLLTGQTPPEAAEVYEEGLPEIRGYVSDCVKEAISKAMAPKRKDRPQDIASFLSLLPSSQEIDASSKKEYHSIEETKIPSSDESTVVQPTPAKEPEIVTPKPATPTRNETPKQSHEGSKSTGGKTIIFALLGILALAGILWLLFRNPYSTEAERTYRKDAERGNAEAQYNLGACFENGNGVNQDFAQAAQWYAKAAKQGLADAQVALGILFATGHGVKEDISAACDMFRRAAEQGDIDAQVYLGRQYLVGEGVKQDWSEAKKWLYPAAEKGDDRAQNMLAYIYLTGGNGTTKDNYLAFKWFKDSAEQGNDDAQFYTGVCYYFGYGTKKDYKLSAEWWKKASEQDNILSQYNLGLCYLNGYGVKKDIAEAKRWLQKAADGGCDDAKKLLADLSSASGLKNSVSTTSTRTNTGSTKTDNNDIKEPDEAMTLSKTNLTVFVGETEYLSASNYGTSLVWKSHDPTIATVSSNGVVVGKKEGIVLIDAIGKETKTCFVTVKLRPSSSSVGTSINVSSNTNNTRTVSSQTLSISIGEKVQAQLDGIPVEKWEHMGKDDVIVAITGKTIKGLRAGTAKLWGYVSGSPKLFTVTVKGSSSSTTTSNNANRTISGTVRNADGVIIVGAAIVVIGTTRGTVTDKNGKYWISAQTGEALSVTCIGYYSNEQIIGSSDNTINFTLRKK